MQRATAVNTRVEKLVKGQRVVARPVFKGGAMPAYWVGAVNGHSLAQTFGSAGAVFRHVAGRPRHH
jgi:hypothetical protein